jgi:hypothetical protein
VGWGVSGQTIVFIYTLVKPNKRVAGRDSQLPGFGFTKLLKNNFFVTFFRHSVFAKHSEGEIFLKFFLRKSEEKNSDEICILLLLRTFVRTYLRKLCKLGALGP